MRFLEYFRADGFLIKAFGEAFAHVLGPGVSFERIDAYLAGDVCFDFMDLGDVAVVLRFH